MEKDVMEKDVKLTDEQLGIVKGIALFAEAFCNQVYHIMQNHGLDKVNGCCVRVNVDPSLDMTGRHITIGFPGSDFGNCYISRGRNEDNYSLFGRNSCTYEELFGQQTKMVTDPDVEAKIHAVNVPLPEDGFWF